MLDVELFGLDAGLHHQVNLLLHLANTLLLFSLLCRFTGARWRSFMVAALFGLHPLHVESVAWISERKDVLSTLFWLLTMWFYSRYHQRTTAIRYALVFLSLGLGLLVKPMLVSLPLVLLLLDYWPLKRLDGNQQGIPFRRLVLEKVPLFGLAAASCLITYIAQSRGHSIVQPESLGLPFRLANAPIAYVTYLVNTFWPTNLAVFYPHPGPAVSLAAAAASMALLAVVSWLAFRNRQENPSVFVGWFWYVVTLLPVAGLVQVGSQARADRYTYIPLIGVFVAFCWMLPRLLREWRHRKPALTAIAAGVLLCLIPLARAQVNCWQNNITLYNKALAATKGNYMAYCNLGRILEMTGRIEEAIAQYNETLQIDPNSAIAHYNLEHAMERIGRFNDAAVHYRQSLQANPNDRESRWRFENILSTLRRG